MNSKKIEFTKKPSLKETNLLLDKWVTDDKSVINKNKLKRTTIYLPEELHKKLKIKAINSETSMTDIIIETLEKTIC